MILPCNGKSPTIHNRFFLAPDCVIIGNVSIGAECSVWFKAIVRDDINHIRIGSFTNLQDGCIVHVTGETSPMEIGNYVTIGHEAIIHGCRIMDGCFIGMRVIVIDDAVIGEGSLVATGAVVKSGMRVPPNSLLAGNPAAVIKKSIGGGNAVLH